MTRFSIVIPVYDEAAFLPVGLSRMVEELVAAGLDYRILVMDNGSNDGTPEIARRVADDLPEPDRVEVHSLPDPDYGAAMREGFIRADGEWVVNFDIDYFSADFLEKVLDLADEADLVIASKRDKESDDRRSPLRRLATAVFNLLLRSMFGSGVSDTHGMKAFRRQLVADVVPAVQSRQDLFDTELVLRAERRGYRIREVPVVVEELRPARSLVKRVPRTLRGLWEIRRILDDAG
ncbi:MAG TPA: glycosyltransferase [Acidimicrobiia bacterium]|nr:glycosyltransferase [Acidimicrobiia bacterium]